MKPKPGCLFNFTTGKETFSNVGLSTCIFYLRFIKQSLWQKNNTKRNKENWKS